MHRAGVTAQSKRRMRGRGWTLVELLIVVAILGVLSGVAWPKYQQYRERIRVSQAERDIRVLQLLIKDYQLDHGNRYPDSLAEVGNAQRLDPWGRPYVYVNLTAVQGKGKARKDRKLNPINSDYDLYSVGKDGVSKPQLSNKDSLDDVVRANDGAYIGLAAHYTR